MALFTKYLKLPKNKVKKKKLFQGSDVECFFLNL